MKNKLIIIIALGLLKEYDFEFTMNDESFVDGCFDGLIYMDFDEFYKNISQSKECTYDYIHKASLIVNGLKGFNYKIVSANNRNLIVEYI